MRPAGLEWIPESSDYTAICMSSGFCCSIAWGRIFCNIFWFFSNYFWCKRDMKYHVLTGPEMLGHCFLLHFCRHLMVMEVVSTSFLGEMGVRDNLMEKQVIWNSLCASWHGKLPWNVQHSWEATTREELLVGFRCRKDKCPVRAPKPHSVWTFVHCNLQVTNFSTDPPSEIAQTIRILVLAIMPQAP